MKVIGEALTPETSFLMMMLADTDIDSVVKSMAVYSADVVTLTFGDELSGQVAAYVAGAASDPSGDVVARAGGVEVSTDGESPPLLFERSTKRHRTVCVVWLCYPYARYGQIDRRLPL
jgi:hypothetical protein